MRVAHCALSREHFSSSALPGISLLASLLIAASFHQRLSCLLTCLPPRQVLAKVGGTRLIVGHTPQIAGANCECEGQVWRMDVGMSYGVLNRPVQVRCAGGMSRAWVCVQGFLVVALGCMVRLVTRSRVGGESRVCFSFI